MVNQYQITSKKTGNFWKLKKFVKPFLLSVPWVFWVGTDNKNVPGISLLKTPLKVRLCQLENYVRFLKSVKFPKYFGSIKVNVQSTLFSKIASF